MNLFEEAGKKSVKEMIVSLENAQKDWIPFFFHTGSYEGDIAQALILRKNYQLEEWDNKND